MNEFVNGRLMRPFGSPPLSGAWLRPCTDDPLSEGVSLGRHQYDDRWVRPGGGGGGGASSDDGTRPPAVAVAAADGMPPPPPPPPPPGGRRRRP